MTYENLLKYIKGVFDTEMSLYVQENTLDEMRDTYDGLATGIKVFKPSKKRNDESIVDNASWVAILCSIIAAVFCAGLMLFDTGEHIILRIIVAIFAFFVGGLIGYGAGLVIGAVVGIVKRINNQRKIDERYERDLVQYEKDLSKDRLRLSIEQKKKNVLKQEIAKMENQIVKTRQNLSKMYSYGIIAPEYRNMTVVGVFYSYLVTERTYSLGFDRETGDKGAYNLYESERRMNILIANTEEILDCMDSLARSQHELAEGLRLANQQISNMQRDFNRFATQTVNRLDDIREIQSVTTYNTTCIREQMEFMSWLAATRYKR